MKRIALLGTVLIILSLACSLNPENLSLPEELPDPGSVATTVAGTVAAQFGDQVEDPSPPEDLYNTGTVNGHVCYPSEFIPEMTVYFENINTQEVTPFPIPENQPGFSVPLPEGTYVAYAWLPDFSSGGLYSQAVPCGLNVSCTDHSLIEFNVTQGGTVNNVQVCDWYISPSQIPYPPGVNYSQIHGSISGNLGYPAEHIPALTVVATNMTTNQFYFVQTAENDSTYLIEHLPPADYTVVAYESEYDVAGGYTQSVPCGLSVNCTDHSLIPVMVVAGQATTGVDPVDFYAPAGTFPPNRGP